MLSNWNNLVESCIKDCKETEQRARRERELWERLCTLLPEAEQCPFALLSLTEQIRNLNGQRAELLREIEQYLSGIAQEQVSRYRYLLELV